MRSKVKVFIIIISAILVLALLFYFGVLHINNPSQKTYPVRGVDASNFQGEVDWNTLSEQNISFAYIKATDGASLPFNYNLKEKNPTLFNEIDPLHQDRINYLTSSFTNAYTLPSKYNFPLNKYGHVDAFYLSNGYDFFTKIRKDGKEPQQYYDDTIAYYTDTVWNDTLRNAGLR